MIQYVPFEVFALGQRAGQNEPSDRRREKKIPRPGEAMGRRGSDQFN